jgi:flagellar L-ring protein precursor FlgH
MRALLTFLVVTASAITMFAGSRKNAKKSSLQEYLDSCTSISVEVPVAPSGSLWSPQASFAELSSDFRAQRVNDLVIIRIVEQTLAQASADVSSQRKLQASSAIPSVAGQSFRAVNPLFSLNSDNTLDGKGQSNSQTKLQTSVAGRIAAVLPNGLLVVEAERRVHMNNETQTILLRGLLRPADVQSDNSVPSTALANLQIDLKGKGVVSDSTRPPNRLLRALFWLAGF